MEIAKFTSDLQPAAHAIILHPVIISCNFLQSEHKIHLLSLPLFLSVTQMLPKRLPRLATPTLKQTHPPTVFRTHTKGFIPFQAGEVQFHCWRVSASYPVSQAIKRSHGAFNNVFMHFHASLEDLGCALAGKVH